MSDKTILEQWRAIAYDQQADRNKLQQFWAKYFNIEKNIYAQLLENPSHSRNPPDPGLYSHFIICFYRSRIYISFRFRMDTDRYVRSCVP